MVNNPNSVPPNSQGPTDPHKASETKPKPNGSFQFTGDHKFLGMTFTANDWNKLMNILLRNMNDYINKTFQKMTEKMKKDWKRGAGEEVDD
jgi:hypothetical protein